MICRKVVLEVGAKPPGYGPVIAGVNGVRRLVTPHGTAAACFASRFTEEHYVARIREEEEKDYAVVYAEDAAGRYVFVWPGEIYRWLVDGAEAVLEGRGRATPMYILAGPPGSGKTTLASVVIPAKFGVPSDVISPAGFLSKWVGESEKNLQKFFMRARLAQPYVLVFDEGDALIARWSGASGSGEGEVTKNVQTVAKKELSEIYTSRYRVFVAVTTNLEPDEILPEFKRRGRGVLVEVPYLDTAGLRLLVDRLTSLHGVKCNNVDIVSTAAKRKMSPADISEWVERLAKDCRAPPPKGLSKAPDTVLNAPARKVQCEGDLCRNRCLITGVHYRVEYQPYVDVDAVASSVVRYLIEDCGTPPVVLMTLKREDVKEAITMAKASKSPLVVYPEISREEYFTWFASVKEVPVLFIQPDPTRLPLNTYVRGRLKVA
jgi:hypothetical protein